MWIYLPSRLEEIFLSWQFACGSRVLPWTAIGVERSSVVPPRVRRGDLSGHMFEFTGLAQGGYLVSVLRCAEYLNEKGAMSAGIFYYIRGALVLDRVVTWHTCAAFARVSFFVFVFFFLPLLCCWFFGFRFSTSC